MTDPRYGNWTPRFSRQSPGQREARKRPVRRIKGCAKNAREIENCFIQGAGSSHATLPPFREVVFICIYGNVLRFCVGASRTNTDPISRPEHINIMQLELLDNRCGITHAPLKKRYQLWKGIWYFIAHKLLKWNDCLGKVLNSFLPLETKIRRLRTL